MPLRYILPPTATVVGFDLVSQSTYQYMRSHKELEALEDFIRKNPTSKPEVQYKFVTLLFTELIQEQEEQPQGKLVFASAPRVFFWLLWRALRSFGGRRNPKWAKRKQLHNGQKNGKFPIHSPWKVLGGLFVVASQQLTTGLLFKATFWQPFRSSLWPPSGCRPQVNALAFEYMA